MESVERSKVLLAEMLHSMGLDVEIEGEVGKHGELTLHVATSESHKLIGKEGESLDDIQYLLNRLLYKEDQSFPRVRVDCHRYRERREELLRQSAREAAAEVRATGKLVAMKPMNAYHRKIVYDALLEEEGVEASSGNQQRRFKKVLIKPKE